MSWELPRDIIEIKQKYNEIKPSEEMFYKEFLDCLKLMKIENKETDDLEVSFSFLGYKIITQFRILPIKGIGAISFIQEIDDEKDGNKTKRSVCKITYEDYKKLSFDGCQVEDDESINNESYKHYNLFCGAIKRFIEKVEYE